MDFNETFCVDMWMEIIVLSTPEPNHVKQKLDVELFRKGKRSIYYFIFVSIKQFLCIKRMVNLFINIGSKTI